MKRTYIAGPMTGLPDLNFPAFHAAAAYLRGLGYPVESPAEINADPAAGWVECMKLDIVALVQCERIYLLHGWQLSRGARLEFDIATALSLDVVFQWPGEALPERMAA